MTTFDQPQFTIVGAGLAGVLMACYLGKAGYRVAVHEKRGDPRGHAQERGRSINLALSVRGLYALREVGLAEAVLADAIPMRGRMIHDRHGRQAFQPYGKDESHAIHSVSRAGLNLTLVQAAARYPGVRFYFEHKCMGLDLATNTLELVHTPSGSIQQVPAAVVIGADGGYSVIRSQLQKQDRFDYQQHYLTHGYKELTIPPGPDGGFQLEPNALHIWPRRTFMMIALPNRDGSFTCTLFYPFEGADSFAALRTEAEIRRLFTREFPDAAPLLPRLTEEFHQNPTGSLVTIRCQPWHVGGRVVLLGDACHAVVPFLGQGMNAAFEDCSVLAECLCEHAPDYDTAFASYQQRRKEHTEALADLCIANFIEMRDRVGSRLFRLKKRLEILLHRLLPGWYVPLYTLITFTRTPYAEARRRAERQDRLLVGISGGLVLLVMLLGYFLASRG
ncbi:MAG: FAD-dependent oxidoreductase [Gemmataceae bacterium]